MIKKIKILGLVLLLLVSGGCTNKEVKLVEEQIASLGEISLDSRDELQSALNGFRSLSAEKRDKVSNRNELDEAIREYDILLIRNSLRIVNEKMDFISQYAGNVNGAGKRKFADSFLNEIRDAFSALEYSTLLSDQMPKAYEVLMKMSEAGSEIVDLIDDMGETNSSKNVSKSSQRPKI